MRKLDLQSRDFKAAPHASLKEARAAAPFALVKVPLFGPIRAALTHEAVQSVLKDSDRFAVNARNAGHRKPFGFPFMPKSFRLLAENILALDDPDHQRIRRLADTPFRRAAIETRRESVQSLVDSLLDQVARESAAEVDLTEAVFKPLPVQVITHLLGMIDAAKERLMTVMSGFASTSSTFGILRALSGMGGVVKQLRAEIEAARRDPRPGLLSELIQAESETGQMSEDELVSLVLVLFVAGHETTTNLLSAGLYDLQTQTGAWDTAKTLDTDGWRVAVDELMRFSLPVHMTKPRFVIHDTEIAGEPFERGDKVIAVLGAANLDPAVFDDPLTLDLARRPNRHTGWGGGPHICLGLHLAKMETEVALARMVERWPSLSLGEDLKWSRRLGVRGLEKMPVRLDG
jgi:cytochrome P450